MNYIPNLSREESIIIMLNISPQEQNRQYYDNIQHIGEQIRQLHEQESAARRAATDKEQYKPPPLTPQEQKQELDRLKLTNPLIRNVAASDPSITSVDGAIHKFMEQSATFTSRPASSQPPPPPRRPRLGPLPRVRFELPGDGQSTSPPDAWRGGLCAIFLKPHP